MAQDTPELDKSLNKWEFKLKDGNSENFILSDDFMKEMESQYPSMKFTW